MSESPPVVEVVFALPREQRLVAVPFQPGMTADQAITLSGIGSMFPGVDLSEMKIAIWGRLAERGDRLRAGDRLEILRPLLIDPRTARRNLAKAGQTMGGSSPEVSSDNPDTGH